MQQRVQRSARSSGPTLDGFASIARILRGFGLRDSSERIRSMRELADSDPGSELAPWVAAIAFWEEGQTEEAKRLADVCLEESPADFRMLVICLDWSIRVGNPELTLSFAKRVVDAKSPSRQLRRVHAVMSVVLWPLRPFLGSRDGLKVDADNLDKWAEWAKAHVAAAAKPSVGTNV